MSLLSDITPGSESLAENQRRLMSAAWLSLRSEVCDCDPGTKESLAEVKHVIQLSGWNEAHSRCHQSHTFALFIELSSSFQSITKNSLGVLWTSAVAIIRGGTNALFGADFCLDSSHNTRPESGQGSPKSSPKSRRKCPKSSPKSRLKFLRSNPW